MKIIYCTDIHGSFLRIYNLLHETIADLYIISGDIIDLPFYSLDLAIEYYETQNMFYSMRRESNGQHILLEDYVESLFVKKGINDLVRDKARYYLDASVKAQEIMKKKYRLLENILSVKNNTPIVSIPGNYDMDLTMTALAQRNLHMKSIIVDNLKIAGYGGADVHTPGFPERYMIRYGGKATKDTDSELYHFLEKEKPDIIAAHHPAYGIMDTISYLGSWGSPSLRSYCDNHRVIACLTGHIHENWGVRASDTTVYLNPSNFGEVMTPQGEISEGGFFFEIIVEDGRVPVVYFKKIVDTRIYDIAEYGYDGAGYRESIIDHARLQALRQLTVVDENMERYNQIPELKIFRDIRNFFRIYQTKQTEERIKNLEKAMESLGQLSGHIAMDLVGSVNMGIAQDSSDVDAVLYLKNARSCGEDFESCDFAKDITGRIKDFLKDRHGFEVIDFINLDLVEESIHSENVDCELTQRFAIYRSFCRPINYKIIAPVEDLLNGNLAFRKEVEENMRSYLRVLGTTQDIRKSFDKYLTRLKTMGVTIPDSMIHRIEMILQKNM
jgi:Icc-related predicted phosphoesterase